MCQSQYSYSNLPDFRTYALFTLLYCPTLKEAPSPGLALV